MNIFSEIEKAQKNKLPFAVYRKPNSSTLKGWFQKNDTLFTSKKYNESGFIFAPFNDKDTAILLPENQSTFLQEETNFVYNTVEKNTISNNYTSKESHIAIVSKGIQAIKDNLFKKVVLSRKEVVPLTDFNSIATFKKLLTNYPNAFTYIWFHPKIGMWLGATPETLVKIDGTSFKTMSLAGTQVYDEKSNVFWQPKEIEEQQFVTKYITDKLSNICNVIKSGDVETIKAGNLLHLRTLISGEISTEISTLIKKLHPTPAVCGLPLAPSKEFIMGNENYKRTYYTGFLGELNLKKDHTKSSELFVNLRCMEVMNHTAFVFVGGGITKNSNPKSEWEETVAKTKTMKKVLEVKS